MKAVRMMESQKNKRFDEIDKMFENLQKANDETVDSFKKRLNQNESEKARVDLAGINANMKKSMMIKRPVVPDNIDVELGSRYEYFLYIVQNVNYGTSNSESYVKGHRKALNKYLHEADRNPTNLTLIKAAISDEINDSLKHSKTSLESKGYFDGLNYLNKALKKSKEIMANKINEILKRELS